MASDRRHEPEPPGHPYDRSVDGSVVHRPTTVPGAYGPATAICRDGSTSYSHHVRGTCSGHQGVEGWVNMPE